MTTDSQLKLIEQWRATGRLAFVKRMGGKDRISLNGGAYIPLKDGLEKIREFFRKSNPADGFYVIRAVGSGKAMYFTGKKFSDDRLPRTFYTKVAARNVARELMRRNPLLRNYQIAVVSKSSIRHSNPASRSTELAESQKLFREFTGHRGNTVLRRHVKPIKVGLAFGILDDVGYTTIRDGRVEAYRHAFSKNSRPLLIVNHDGTQLGIVGGRYQFTEAGIEDR